MKRSALKLIANGISILALLFFGSGLAWAQDDQVYQDNPNPQTSDNGYQGRVARLSLVEGDVSIQHGADQPWLDAVINAPLMQGDRIWVGQQGRTEIEMDDGSYIRLASNSILEVQQLGLTSAGRYTQVFLSQGLAYFNIRESYNDVFRVTTPILAADTNGGTHFRLAVDDQNDLVVFRGQIHVDSRAGDVMVRQQEYFSLANGDSARYSLSSAPPADGWDQWNFDRDNYLSQATSYEYVPSNVGYGVYDLDRYGHWVYQPGYGYVWAPYNEDADWLPYSDGRWGYYPGMGYTWISYEPWGWLPYHYGSWAYISGFGWGWCPGAAFSYWSPARVWFFGFGNYWGWCPFSPFDTFYGGGFFNINSFRPRNFFSNRVVVVNRSTFINNAVNRESLVRNREVINQAVNSNNLRFSGQPQIQRTANSEILRPFSGNNSRVQLASDTKGWGRSDGIRGTGARPSESLRMATPFAGTRSGIANREGLNNGNVGSGPAKITPGQRSETMSTAPSPMWNTGRSEVNSRPQGETFNRNATPSNNRMEPGNRGNVQAPALRTPYSGVNDTNRGRVETRTPTYTPPATNTAPRNEGIQQRQATPPRNSGNEKAAPSRTEKPKSNTSDRSSYWQSPSRESYSYEGVNSGWNNRSSYQASQRIEKVGPNSYRSAPSYNSTSAYRNEYQSGYANSAPRYSAPSYSAPAPRYQAYSAPRYEAPRSTYSAPVQHYSAPVQRYSAPVQHFSAPRQSYSAPSYHSSGSSSHSFSAPHSSGGRRR